MRTFRTKRPPTEAFRDVGTLWTMERRQAVARCKLLSEAGRLELRVVVDGAVILADVCGDAADAFSLAEHWKTQLRDRGWRQIVPGANALGV